MCILLTPDTRNLKPFSSVVKRNDSTNTQSAKCSIQSMWSKTEAISISRLLGYVVLPMVVIMSGISEVAEAENYEQGAESTQGSSHLPGTEGFDAALWKRFDQARESRGKLHRPRTKHRLPDGTPKYTNRLYLESSPYLIQHAHNPVNWYPWGEAAFAQARRLDRPMLLSIGYSTCHWCHVMEEESFEDEEIARYLNEHYISVKVDREERPDIDAIYMSAVQALTGGGGWPMTVWLTPDQKPFYGGTYFPARDGERGASIGFLTLLKRLSDIYGEKKDMVAQSSRQITEAIQKMLIPAGGSGPVETELLGKAFTHFREHFDPVNGGLKGAPKFPSSLPIRLLLRHYRSTGDTRSLEMAEKTLTRMAAGGMYDHIGGGFHRYSTDEEWLVPHFEKMLYDNALLTTAYIEGYLATGRASFKQTAEEILRYVEREMSSPEGAFYSATDADSLNADGQREEGWFFTWTSEEIESVLGADRAEIVKAYYSVGKRSDFEGRHIMHTSATAKEVAEGFGISEEGLLEILAESRRLLYNYRDTRPQPLRDEKVLTAWNGLMISAFARAGLIFGDAGLVERAKKAALFVLENLVMGGRLFRSFKDGTPKHNAYLDDYAFFITALIDLYEADQEPMWLERAIFLDSVLERRYEDKVGGGFFMTSDDHENLIAREKPAYDGALPSGNSYAASYLLRLYALTGNRGYRSRAETALRSFSAVLNRNPAVFSEMLLAVETLRDSTKEIVIVTPEGEKGSAEPFLAELRRTFVPDRSLVVVQEGEELAAHEELVPIVRGKTAIGGKTTAYVCEEGVCKLPVTEPVAFAQQIRDIEY